jgi:hypothetical protein
MFGLFLLLVQYLQAVLGYSAIRATSGLLPMAAVLMVFLVRCAEADRPAWHPSGPRARAVCRRGRVDVTSGVRVS